MTSLNWTHSTSIKPGSWSVSTIATQLNWTRSTNFKPMMLFPGGERVQENLLPFMFKFSFVMVTVILEQWPQQPFAQDLTIILFRFPIVVQYNVAHRIEVCGSNN